MDTFELIPQEQPKHYDRLGPNIPPLYRNNIENGNQHNYVIRQVRLIWQQCVLDNPEGTIDAKKLEEATKEWGEKGRGIKYSEIFEHPKFNEHPRFQGDVAKITLEDINTPLSELFDETE